MLKIEAKKKNYVNSRKGFFTKKKQKKRKKNRLLNTQTHACSPSQK